MIDPTSTTKKIADPLVSSPTKDQKGLNDIDTIVQLEPIMRRLGIWPKEICRHYDLWVYNFKEITDRHTFAIVRDAAEEWLKSLPRFVDYGWSRQAGKMMYVFLSPREMVPVEISSLPEALEYAMQNKMGGKNE